MGSAEDRERAGEGAKEWGGSQDGGRWGPEPEPGRAGPAAGRVGRVAGRVPWGTCPRRGWRGKSGSVGAGRALGRGLPKGAGSDRPVPRREGIWVGSRLRTAPLWGCLEPGATRDIHPS